MNENYILSGLNPEQKKAVQIQKGSLLILAGAGSGKTKCLTHRIAYLIQNGVPANKILAVTFTNKAANEMKERIKKLLETSDNFFSSPYVGTFHSMCVKILRKDIEKINNGITSNFIIFDTKDAENLIKTIMTDLQKLVGEMSIKPKAVLAHISSAKNKLYTPEKYQNITVENQYTKIVKIVFPIYQKKLIQHNALDFDDLLNYTVDLFQKNSAILDKYQKIWEHISIDEYQDTNLAQYRIIKLLTQKHNNLCVIGDDSQSIYSFRGADFRNILNFKKDFPNANIIKLEQNYRSTGNILANANKIIAKNITGVTKKLWTENNKGDSVNIIKVNDEKTEGDFITQKIKELIAESEKNGSEKKLSYKDFAILYRKNFQSRILEERFMRASVPYQLVGGFRFFDRKEVKDLIFYLRLIFNPADNLAFVRIINIPSRKIGASSIEILKNYAQKYNMCFLDVLKNIDMVAELPNTKKNILSAFYNLIQNCANLVEKNNVSKILDKIIDDTDFIEYLKDGTEEGKSRIQNIQELRSVSITYDYTEDALGAFLETVALISDLDNFSKKSDAVTMMTMHSSKGLEFPVVFLPAWETDMFPALVGFADKEDLEEERRLAYVALTRAQKKCFILHTTTRCIFGNIKDNDPSLFLSELDPQATQIYDLSRNQNNYYKNKYTKSQSSNFDHTKIPKNRTEAIFGISENNSDFAPGDNILHDEFGKGTIIQVQGDLISIAFPGKGIQKIVESVTPIKKI